MRRSQQKQNQDIEQNKIEQSPQSQESEDENDIQYRFKKIEMQMNSLLSVARECLSSFLQTGRGKVTPLHQQLARKRRKQNTQIESDEEENDNFKLEIQIKLNQQPGILEGGELQKHQLIGLNWLIQMWENDVSVILADDMGLGKTIQIISLIAYLTEFRSIKRPFLIVVPKSTITNWCNEFYKWLPSCRVIRLLATQEEREEALLKIKKNSYDVIVTTYEGAKKCFQQLQKIKFKSLIVDEAHKLKNENSQISMVLKSLNYQHGIILTGTPLQNNLHELWALLNFVMPDIFENEELFDSWFEELSQIMTKQEIEEKNKQFFHKLHQILEIFMLRRTKKETLVDLPPKKEIHIYSGLTKLQVEIYQNLLTSKTANGVSTDKTHYNNLLMQLRKVCCHPYLFPEMEPDDAPIYGNHIIDCCGKMIILDKLLQKLFQEKHQVVLFSQFTMLLNIIEDYCVYRKFKYARIDGQTSLDDRDNQMQDFQKQGSDIFIFLLSTRAGGLGINLQSADTVIIYDSDFNPQVDLQAIDRVHRYGQTKPVMVYRLITENTVEEKIRERSYIKLKWDSLVIQQRGFKGQADDKFNNNTLKSIVNFGASKIVKAQNGTISNESIDELLKRGEEKTDKELQEIDEMLKQQHLGLALESIDCQNFNLKKFEEDEVAIDELQAKLIYIQKQKQQNIKDIQKEPKQIQVYDFQFFPDPDRLEQLLQIKENARYYKEVYQAIKADPTINIQQKLKGLTPEEVEEKDLLLQQGFINWNLKEFEDFCESLCKFKKDNYEAIQAAVETKSIDEIMQYSQAFWENSKKEFSEETFMKKILRAQVQLVENDNFTELLERKFSQYSDPDQVDFDEELYKNFTSSKKSIKWDFQYDKMFMYFCYKKGYKPGQFDGLYQDLLSILDQQLCQKSKIRFNYLIKFLEYEEKLNQTRLKQKELLNLVEDKQKQKKSSDLSHSEIDFTSENVVKSSTSTSTDKNKKDRKIKDSNQKNLFDLGFVKKSVIPKRPLEDQVKQNVSHKKIKK